MNNAFNITVKTLKALVILTTATLLPMSVVSANVNSTVLAETKQQQADCACFEVQVYGKGPAILLIPGLASSGAVWQSTVEALKDKYQLHVFTLAGFAGVAPLSQQQWSHGYIATQQQAILNYIKQNQLNKPVIIGHSLGGFLALSLAINNSDSLTAAINIDGLPALGELFKQSAASSTEYSPNGFDPVEMAKSMANNTDWQQRIVTEMQQSDGMTSGRVMGELMQQDIRPELSKISVPVLTLGALLNGAPYSTPEQVKASYESQLENAPSAYHQMAYATDSRHFIMADAPEWMNNQITQFLANIPGVGTEKAQ